MTKASTKKALVGGRLQLADHTTYNQFTAGAVVPLF